MRPQHLQLDAMPAAINRALHPAAYSSQLHTMAQQACAAAVLDGSAAGSLPEGHHGVRSAAARQPLQVSAAHGGDGRMSRMNSADNSCAGANGTAHGELLR